MSVVVLGGIGLVGGLGALGRFLLDTAVTERAGDRFPWGTMAVNVSGAFALGVLVGAAVGGDGLRLAGIGVLGAFTTFSTWAFETHRLAEDGQLRLGIANLVLSLFLGLGAVWLGRHAGALL